MREANYLIVFVTVVCRLFFMFCAASKHHFQFMPPVDPEVEATSRSLYVRVFAAERIPGSGPAL